MVRLDRPPHPAQTDEYVDGWMRVLDRHLHRAAQLDQPIAFYITHNVSSPPAGGDAAASDNGDVGLDADGPGAASRSGEAP